MCERVCARGCTRERERDVLRDVDSVHSSLNCLVYPDWFYHKMVFGLKDYVKK